MDSQLPGVLWDIRQRIAGDRRAVSSGSSTRPARGARFAAGKHRHLGRVCGCAGERRHRRIAQGGSSCLACERRSRTGGCFTPR